MRTGTTYERETENSPARNVTSGQKRDRSQVGTEAGQESNSRDCPTKIGTVGNYAMSFIGWQLCYVLHCTHSCCTVSGVICSVCIPPPLTRDPKYNFKLWSPCKSCDVHCTSPSPQTHIPHNTWVLTTNISHVAWQVGIEQQICCCC